MGKENIHKKFHKAWHAIRTHNRGCSYGLANVEAEKKYYSLFDQAMSGDVLAQKLLAGAYYNRGDQTLVRKSNLAQAVKWYDQAAQPPRQDEQSIRMLFQIACDGEKELDDKNPNFIDGREVMKLKAKAFEYARQAGFRLGPG